MTYVLKIGQKDINVTGQQTGSSNQQLEAELIRREVGGRAGEQSMCALLPDSQHPLLLSRHIAKARSRAEGETLNRILERANSQSVIQVV